MSQEHRSRILVVDDMEDAADSMALLLRLWGHDAEVCYRLDRFRLTDGDRREPGQVWSEGGEPERTDCDADEHETEHRADVQAVEERDDDAGGAEDDQRLFVEGGIERIGFHPRNLAARGGIRLPPILSSPGDAPDTKRSFRDGPAGQARNL